MDAERREPRVSPALPRRHPPRQAAARLSGTLPGHPPDLRPRSGPPPDARLLRPFLATHAAGPGRRPAPPVRRPPHARCCRWPANPHVAFSGVVLDRLAAVLAALGLQERAGGGRRRERQPPPAARDGRAGPLGACHRADRPAAWATCRHAACRWPCGHTRHGLAGFIRRAAARRRAAGRRAAACTPTPPTSARMIKPPRRAPVLLLGADHPESIKHAYAGAKLLARRLQPDELRPAAGRAAACRRAPRPSRRAWPTAPTASWAPAAGHWALVDPAGDLQDPPTPDLLSQLLDTRSWQAGRGRPRRPAAFAPRRGPASPPAPELLSA